MSEKMRRSPVTQDDINRWKDQGLGQGEGNVYKPWIDVRSFSSKGRSSRAPGITTGRTHHVFSDNEDNFCLMADFAKNIVAIYEQFPLLPEEHTQRIATCLGIRHPRYPNSKTPLVMTTDFFLTRTNNQGKHSPLAVSVKSANDLRGAHRARTLAKLEIERRYWSMRNVPWLLITDEDINETLIANLDWLNYVVVESSLPPPLLSQLIPAFLSTFRAVANKRLPLAEMVKSSAVSLGGINEEFAYQLFRHAVWHHLIEVDLSVPIRPLHVPTILSIANLAKQQGREGDIHGFQQRRA
jgi:hypothetical protein